MNPFERGWNGGLLTEAERRSRSGVVWPQGSMASDAVYPLLHEINPQPSGREVYPFASNDMQQWASPGSFSVVQANGVTGVSDWLGGTGQPGLTEAERKSQQRPWLAMTEGRSADGVPLWPQGSRASDAVYPLWAELCPEPPSDVVYPLLHELNPQPPGREVYPFLPKTPIQPHFVDMIMQPDGVAVPRGWLGSAGQLGVTELQRQSQLLSWRRKRNLYADELNGVRQHPVSSNFADPLGSNPASVMSDLYRYWDSQDISGSHKDSCLACGDVGTDSIPLRENFFSPQTINNVLTTEDNPHLISYFQYPDFEPEKNEEALIRSSSLNEAIARLLKQTSLVSLLNHSNARSLLDGYLHSNPTVASAMLFPLQETLPFEQVPLSYAPVFLAYPEWDTALKDRLAYFFATLLEVWRELIKTKSIKHVTLEKIFPIDPDKNAFSWNEARDIFLAYVAHSLLVEIAELVPWRLHWYSRESLLFLFSAENTIINIAHWPSSVYNSIAESKTGGRIFVVGRKAQNMGYAPQPLPYFITPINPIQIFLFLEERNLINRTGFPVHPLETGLPDVATSYPSSSKNMRSLFGIKGMMDNKGFPFYMWYDDQVSSRPREIKRTLSVLCRWFMYYVRHSSFPYGSYVLRDSRLIFTGCPIDRCLSLPIPEKRKRISSTRSLIAAQNILRNYFPNVSPKYELKLLNNHHLLFDKNGTPASFMSISNNSWELVWARFTAFTGCHGAAGIFYWMLRSLNIPSEIVPTYQSDRGNASNPAADGDHKGIVVFVPKDIPSSSDEELCLFHLDEIYATIQSFDPLIDPLNYFIDRKTFDRWFSPPLRSNTVMDDFEFFAIVLGMKYLYGRYPALSVKDGVESVLKNYYDVYDGRIWLTHRDGKKEFKELRTQLSQILTLRKQQIENDLNLPLGFGSTTYYADWLNFVNNRYQYITNTIGIFAENPIKETKIIK